MAPQGRPWGSQHQGGRGIDTNHRGVFYTKEKRDLDNKALQRQIEELARRITRLEGHDHDVDLKRDEEVSLFVGVDSNHDYVFHAGGRNYPTRDIDCINISTNYPKLEDDDFSDFLDDYIDLEGEPIYDIYDELDDVDFFDIEDLPMDDVGKDDLRVVPDLCGKIEVCAPPLIYTSDLDDVFPTYWTEVFEEVVVKQWIWQEFMYDEFLSQWMKKLVMIIMLKFEEKLRNIDLISFGRVLKDGCLQILIFDPGGIDTVGDASTIKTRGRVFSKKRRMMYIMRKICQHSFLEYFSIYFPYS